MTINLNADIIDFNTVSERKVRTDIQVNHAAVAACLCALVLIGILLSPSIFSSFSATSSSTSPTSTVNQEVDSAWHMTAAE